MDIQIDGLRDLVAANSYWVTEHGNSTFTNIPVAVEDTFITPEAYWEVHPWFPRWIARAGEYSFDNHQGNCTDYISIYCTIELPRPKVTDANLQAQYESVLGVYRNILEELSGDSYGPGGGLAMLKVAASMCPMLYDPAEDPVVDSNGDDIFVWFMDVVLESKTS